MVCFEPTKYSETASKAMLFFNPRRVLLCLSNNYRKANHFNCFWSWQTINVYDATHTYRKYLRLMNIVTHTLLGNYFTHCTAAHKQKETCMAHRNTLMPIEGKWIMCGNYLSRSPAARGCNMLSCPLALIGQVSDLSNEGSLR